MTPDPSPAVPAIVPPTYPGGLNDKPLPPPPPRRSSLSSRSFVLSTASPGSSTAASSSSSSPSTSAPPSPAAPLPANVDVPAVAAVSVTPLPAEADMVHPVETESKIENGLAKATELYDKATAIAEQVDTISSNLGGAKLVAEFLESVVSSLPMGGVVCKCFSIMYEAQQTASANADLASTLFDRVTFVLNTLRTLYTIGKWQVSTAPQVLTTISTVIQDAAKFFQAYRAKSWFQKRFYGSDIRNTFTSLDTRLSAALSDLQLVLQIETVARLDPPAPSQLASREDVVADRFIATHGGAKAVQANPELVKQLAAAVGTEFSPKLMADISLEFDQLEAQLTAGFQKTLDAIADVSRQVAQVQGGVDELKRRNRTYMDIKCAELRDLWAGAGWGLRVDKDLFAETLVAQVRASIKAGELEEQFEGWDDYTMDTAVDYWITSMSYLDFDGTSEVSVEELNSGFPFDLPLKDYFMLCTFYMDSYSREAIESPVSTIRSAIHLILTMPPATPFPRFCTNSSRTCGRWPTIASCTWTRTCASSTRISMRRASSMPTSALSANVKRIGRAKRKSFKSPRTISPIISRQVRPIGLIGGWAM
ncbi:hypothetical protein BCR44DRAFT_1068274 [Catenaria anguillulae PL171]|uniref:Mixed lineage kinase domain-containing protein n=1 Tax=Catenaria anguillulae PL171 TaxID=765915 RepID=A0A1Y2HPU0_9FUNG|nr:hypothetical protein BCR44DRAFT_1068274 [Catenaria anguillulae PL171]